MPPKLLQPRYYTIASSNLKHPDQVKSAISLTADMIDGNLKYGCLSSHLRSIAEQSAQLSEAKVLNRVFIKDSNFNQPSDHSKIPMIMIGPGTGVVPFIGFMEEREMLTQTNTGMSLAEAYLFFGCRKRDSDFIYRDDISRFKESGIIKESFVALSRDPSQEKQYVQDLMRTKRDIILSVLEQNGNIYICGNTKMGADVQNLLKEFLGEDQFKTLEKEKRIIKELWG